ncbi:C40 family peptidase [Pseudarthrobacter sp. NPDC058362]|uniref:C40 family peptidase n=1 Tax=unclassified Pseudarthrobacter TaxID=2647000 RepID=UPI0036521DB7
MPMIEAVGRMQEIRAALTQMSGQTPPVQQIQQRPAPAGTAAGLPADPAAFDQALEALTASMPGLGGTGTAGLNPATPAATAPGADGPPASAGKIGETAAKYVGLPYIWGGNDPAVGLDCSSFVQNVYRDLGYELPRVTWDQMKQGTAVPSMAQAKPGDLLFSFNGGHVALYLGNGKAIDAPQPGKTIQVRDAWETDANVTAIRRILPAGDVAAASVPGGAGTAGAGDLSGLLAAARSPLMAGAVR